MVCDKCGKKMVKAGWWPTCPNCTKCPYCGKGKAKLHISFGLMPCEECEAKQRKISSTPMNRPSREKRMEYYATPFWKHMGLKPTKQEIAQEKEMKRKGMSYLHLQKA